MNLVRACGLELPEGQSVSSVAFHPTKPVIATAIQSTVYCKHQIVLFKKQNIF